MGIRSQILFSNWKCLAAVASWGNHGDPGVTPLDTLENTLHVQVSQYFTFGTISINQTFSDGQHFANIAPNITYLSLSGIFQSTEYQVDTSHIGVNLCNYLK